MVVEVGGDLLGVQPAGVGLPVVGDDDVELLQSRQFQLDEVLDPLQGDALEAVLVDFGGRLEDGEGKLLLGGQEAVEFDLVDDDKDLAHVQLVLVVVAEELLVDLPRYLPELP